MTSHSRSRRSGKKEKCVKRGVTRSTNRTATRQPLERSAVSTGNAKDNAQAGKNLKVAGLSCSIVFCHPIGLSAGGPATSRPTVQRCVAGT